MQGFGDWPTLAERPGEDCMTVDVDGGGMRFRACAVKIVVGDSNGGVGVFWHGCLVSLLYVLDSTGYGGTAKAVGCKQSFKLG